MRRESDSGVLSISFLELWKTTKKPSKVRKYVPQENYENIARTCFSSHLANTHKHVYTVISESNTIWIHYIILCTVRDSDRCIVIQPYGHASGGQKLLSSCVVRDVWGCAGRKTTRKTAAEVTESITHPVENIYFPPHTESISRVRGVYLFPRLRWVGSMFASFQRCNANLKRRKN